VANALRRILIAEIPTMAFHKVLLYQNTSVIPDEVLVHRIGLMPIKIDAAGFKFRREEESLDASNSLKFELKVKCVRKPQYAKVPEEELRRKGVKPEEYLENAEVYADQLVWVPQGSQKEQYPAGVKLVHERILVVKLREEQEVVMEVYAEKGIGRTHAKWSPVSTAYYRLAPEITILSSFNQEKAADLVSSCPVGVFDIEDGKAYVKNQRKCTTCRQCLKYEGVELGKRN
jgi:DNA-directed RNA polymerase I and III subunit RPAC1